MNTDKFKDFVRVVENRITSNSAYANRCMNNLRPSLVWTGRLIDSSVSLPCDVLPKGCYGAAVEAVSLVSFGLIRPAILSLRSYYELSLQYLYYRDHPIEWRSVSEFRQQPILPSVAKRYLRDNFPKFESRFKALLKVKSRTNDDCYQVLSGIAHATAINSISTATQPADLVESKEVVAQTVDIFRDVGEHTSDIYIAGFEGNWISLPEEIKTDLRMRFGSRTPRDELEF